ncbi:MAG TPA: dihydrodipicolinate synthase family protein [Terriglobia bacterium]|nr:dihydrodipicolinate synthase family protein [Terriglobia bacterium]
MRTPEELKQALRGIVGFGVTPFHDDLSIHYEALRENAAHLAAHCDVVVPLGNNGEIYSLTPEERRAVGSAVVEEVRGRKPVVVGIGYALPVAQELARAAEEYGADGVLLLPPDFTSGNEDGLFEYYCAVASATRLGIVLFQTQSFNFSVPLLERLAEIPNITGLKDENGDMKQFVRQWKAVGSRMELLCGVGEILAPSYFALGVRGFTSGIINFMPQTPRRIWDLLQEGRLEEAARVVEREAIPVFDLRKKRPGYTTLVIKEAMNLCGKRAGPVRPPLAPMTEADRQELRETLKRVGVLRD